jgi:hypothetical protein
MIKWLKSLFGFEAPLEPTLQADKDIAEATVKPVAKKVTKKKTATKKSAKADLSGMSKNDLLAHAKKNGIKANASMKKADILAAINNG